MEGHSKEECRLLHPNLKKVHDKSSKEKVDDQIKQQAQRVQQKYMRYEK